MEYRKKANEKKEDKLTERYNQLARADTHVIIVIDTFIIPIDYDSTTEEKKTYAVIYCVRISIKPHTQNLFTFNLAQYTIYRVIGPLCTIYILFFQLQR